MKKNNECNRNACGISLSFDWMPRQAGHDKGKVSLGARTPSLSSLCKSRRDATRRSIMGECGRSMTEMLGVLAIIGVLSVGAIGGYSYAMDKYRANTTMNDINLRAVDLIAQTDRGGELSLAQWPQKSTVGYDIGLEKEADIATGGIIVSDVPSRVCEMMAESLIQTTTIKIGATEYTDDTNIACGEQNDMVFYYDTVMAGFEKPCNGPIVDGVCGTCSSPFVWDGTNCVCPDNTYVNDYYNATCPTSNCQTCEDCPPNATCEGGVLSCDDGYAKVGACGQYTCEHCPSDAVYSNGRCICNTDTGVNLPSLSPSWSSYTNTCSLVPSTPPSCYIN